MKQAVLKNTDDFRMTKGGGDCGTAIGGNLPNHEEIAELCDLPICYLPGDRNIASLV